MTGQVGTGQVRTNQFGTVQVRTGQVKTSQAGQLSTGLNGQVLLGTRVWPYSVLLVIFFIYHSIAHVIFHNPVFLTHPTMENDTECSYVENYPDY